MASIRKTKKRLKRKLKNAEIIKRILAHEYFLKRSHESLMEVVGARERIERIEQELSNLKTEVAMKKYYFISYLRSAGNAITYGHCMMMAKDSSLNDIAKEVASMNGWDNPVVITCLKDLSKKEYEMLKGKGQ